MTIVNKKAREQPFNSMTLLATSFNGLVFETELSNDDGDFKTLSISGRELLDKDIQSTDITGRDGQYFYSDSYSVREIIVTCLLTGKNSDKARKQFEKLNALLDTSGPSDLRFSDEKDRYYKGTFQKSNVKERLTTQYTLELYFICHDPFKYSLTKSQSLAVTRYNITYNGDFPCKPKMTIRTLAGSEIVLTHVQTGKYIRLKGTYIAGSILVIDCASRKITLNGRNELANFDMVNSRFFEFTKGTNTLHVTGGTLIKVEWQEVFA